MLSLSPLPVVPDDASQLSVTPELDEPLRVLQRNLDLLSRALSAASLRRVWREALERLQELLWGGVLMRQSFTTLGAAQLAHDGAAVAAVVERRLPGGAAGLEALLQGARLLALPAGAGAGAGEGAPAAATTTTPTMTLKEASDLAFAGNDEARRLLRELGLDALTPADARHILERRVENGENVGW